MLPARSAAYDGVIGLLHSRGVAGAEDFGRFVNDTRCLERSTFDDRAALPVLLDVLPTLDDPKAVAAAARHVRCRWLRGDAFDVLRDTYLRWAHRSPSSDAAWALGDALAKATDATRAPELVELATNPELGASRQQIAGSLWRFRKTLDVAPSLRALVHDPDVSLVAVSALGRVIAPEAMVPVLEGASELCERSQDRKVLERELRRYRKKREPR